MKADLPIDRRLYQAVQGAVIAKLRKGKGWTQAELAAQARLTQSMVSRIEGGAAIDGFAVRCLREALSADLPDLTDRALARACFGARALLGESWRAHLGDLGPKTIAGLALLAAEGTCPAMPGTETP